MPELSRKEITELRRIIDDLIDFYKLELITRGRAQKIWFDNGMYAEIVQDFLQDFGLRKAKVRMVKVKDLPKGVGGRIYIPEPCPLLWNSEFSDHRFLIEIKTSAYKDFSSFVVTLTHELAHLLLYSTNNAHRRSEAATDMVVLLYGLEKEFLECSSDTQYRKDNGYLTTDQAKYAINYIKRKRNKKHGTIYKLKGLVSMFKKKLGI